MSEKNTRPHPTEHQIREAEALLRAVKVSGMSVAMLAHVLGISRQSVYRRLQRARVHLRRAAEASPRDSLKEDEYATLCSPGNGPAEADHES